MAEDAQQAVSSPAEPLVTAPEINSFTPEQRQEWLLKGEPFKLPEETPAKSPKAESTPATKPAAEPAETAPDSGTGSPQGKPKGAEARIAELLAERHELRTELELYKKTPKADPSPAVEDKPKTDASGKPVKPKYADYAEAGKPWAEYQADLDKWEGAYESYLLTEATRKVESTLTERQQAESAEKLWSEAEKVHGKEIHAARERVVKATTPEMQIAMSATKDVVALIAHLGKPENEAKLSELVEQFKTSPYGAAITLGRIEAAIEKPAQTEAPVKQTTKAPRPVTEINGRNAAQPDPIKAAIEDDSPAGVKRYMELANARDLEKRRKRA